jgi:ribosomal protein L30/L7E
MRTEQAIRPKLWSIFQPNNSIRIYLIRVIPPKQGKLLDTVGLNRIAAIVIPDNLASRAVIKKIALKEEGTGAFYGIHCLYFGLDKP